MIQSRFTLTLLLCLCLGGCAEPTTIIGQPTAAINAEDVVIYYAEKPGCNFETVAWIQGGAYLSLQSMFVKMRLEAAQIGASGLYIVHTQQTEMKEFLGTAKAIRCLPV